MTLKHLKKKKHFVSTGFRFGKIKFIEFGRNYSNVSILFVGFEWVLHQKKRYISQNTTHCNISIKRISQRYFDS